jgi:hypothetical protein
MLGIFVLGFGVWLAIRWMKNNNLLQSKVPEE